MKKEKEEKILLRMLQKNPEEGISVCIQQYGSGVKAICKRILRDEYEQYVEDAMEESFICLWQDIKNKKKIHTTLQGYLYGIARRQSLKMIRDNKKQHGHISIDGVEGLEEILLSEGANVEHLFAKKQTEKLIHKVIGEMPEPDRTIFLLRFFYFYKIREIAEQLGRAEDAVESKIRRGKEKLKKTLIERGFFYEG